MTTFPNMGLTLPTRGAPGSGAWGDTDDANWALLDAHNHTAGKGLAIPTAGININADLPFSSIWAPTQLHRVQFSAIAAAGLTAGQRTSLFVSDGTSGLVANELYWHNNAGNKVQVTAGNTLNFAAFVGGIGGDYTSVGATLNYVDAQKAYEFREGTADTNKWARLRSGDLRLFPFNSAGVVFVGMAAPGAIAGSYTVTWPLALPAAANVLTIDSSGQVADNGVLGVNQSITVSGTGDYKHGSRTLQIPASAFNPAAGVTVSLNTGSITFAITTNPAAYAPITLTDGARITAIRVYIQDNITGPSTVTATFYSVSTTGAVTNIASSSASAGSGANQTLPIGSLTTTLAASTSYGIKIVETSASGSTCTVYMAEVDYDRP